ncbi:MAG: hypothetical protein ACYC4L_22025 [Chloroflexota bacterium]
MRGHAYPSRLPAGLRGAYTALLAGGPEGQALAAYLAGARPRYWLNAPFLRPGGGLAVTLPLLGRWLCVNVRGLTPARQAGLLAHEAHHLRQNDRQGAGITTQGDEAEAFQLQGRVLAALGAAEGFLWARPEVQALPPSAPAALALLRHHWPLYAAWPVAHPRGRLRQSLAFARQALAATTWALRRGSRPRPPRGA